MPWSGADGRRSTREIVEHGGVAAIVPIDESGNVLLVRQYRAPVDEAILEIPAGGIEEGETPEQAAQRELQEEVGKRAGGLERLTGFYASPGYCSEFIHLFLGVGLSASRRSGDEDEDIEVVRLPMEEALRRVRSGEIRDGKSIIGLLLAAERIGA